MNIVEFGEFKIEIPSFYNANKIRISIARGELKGLYNKLKRILVEKEKLGSE